MKPPKVTIGLSDVMRVGSVQLAVVAAAECIAVGDAFVACGPLPDEPVDDPNYLPRDALEDGAAGYVDSVTGRLCVEIGPDGVPIWTPDSVVRVECPEIDQAILFPAQTAAMARSVVAHHGTRSDRKAWRDLLRSIRSAWTETWDIDMEDSSAITTQDRR